jgi:uncharacterized protein (TIGR03437 family)
MAMIISNWKVNRALSIAVLGLIVCAAPAFAQVPAKRHGQRPANTRDHKTEAPKGRGLSYAPDRYILFLGDEPVAKHFATRAQLQTAAATSYRQQIELRQEAVKQDLAGRNIQVVGAASTVMNAIFVVAPASRLAELRNVSGVIGVMPERRVKPNLNKATAAVNAPAAWAQLAKRGQSNPGSGIKIGIIDTGIDPTSPAFADTGFTAPPGFPKCNAAVTPVLVNGALTLQSDCPLYTNNKVIVARSYVSMIAAGNCAASSLTIPCPSAGAANAANSMPDDYSARDRSGHGSAVAAIAAGVQNSGGTVAFSGMAPGAFLGSYKIYGSSGVSFDPPESVVIKALDDAVNDGMDIVNYSSGVPAVAGALDLGMKCGNPAGVPCDPLAHAFETAAGNGTVVVVAAGNYGSDPNDDAYYTTITSPGTAPSVITVGATVNSHVFGPTVSVNAPGVASNLKGIAAAMSDSGFVNWPNSTPQFYPLSSLYPPILGATSGELVDAGQACSAISAPLTDKWALIEQSTATGCSFDVQAQNAVAAGAIGIIFYMASSGAPAFPNGDGGGICINNATQCDLYGPGVLISASDGLNLKNYLATYIAANPGASVTVTIDTAGAEEALPSWAAANTLAAYSSYGPAIDGSIKPDLVAPGGFEVWLPPEDAWPALYGMYTVGQRYDPNGELFTTNGYVAANGTSFAAPLVAGAAALILKAQPTLKAAQIKSALVNSAAQSVTADDKNDLVDVQEIGAGLLDANAALTAAIAGVTAAPSTLSFGYLATGTKLPITIPVTVTNSGSASVTLAVGVTVGIAAAGASVTPSQTSLIVAPGGSATLNFSLGNSVPTDAGEYEGAVTLTSASPAVSLRIPYMFLVGNGVPFVYPLWDMADWQATNFGGPTYSYGSVNQDLGPLPVQVIDEFGVPMPNVAVTYTVSPSGTASLKSVSGAPGTTGNSVPFQPSVCTPGSSTSTVTCNTNNYGIAWVELVTGATAVGSSSTTTNGGCGQAPACIDATTSAAEGSWDIPNTLSIIPAPSLTRIYENNAGGSTLAPGSYVQMAGSSFADPNFLVNPTAGDKMDPTYSSGRLPLTWDYVTVSFDAPASGNLRAISVPGYVEYVGCSKQPCTLDVTTVNVWVPWELTGYPSVQVKEIYAGSVPIFSNAITAPLATYTPTFFMYSPDNVVLIAEGQDYVNCPAPLYLIGPSCPATQGSTVVFYANGLGPVSNQPASGDPALSSPLSQMPTNPVITIGGQPATVKFAGLSPGFVGLYQINAVIPTGLASGNQPITIAIGGVASPTSVTGGTPPVTYQIVLPIK